MNSAPIFQEDVAGINAILRARKVKGKAGRPPLSDDFIAEGAGGCWLWQRTINHRGYGLAWSGTKIVSAHRFIYELMRGPIAPGMQIDHLCRVRHCVNPSHLEAVTGTMNQRRGNNAKLSIEKARAIRALRGSGVAVAKIAAVFGLGTSHIYDILNNKIWKEVA